MRTVVAVLLAAVSLAGAARAADAPKSAELGRTALHFNQSAERDVPQDRLRVQMRVEVVGQDARTAQSEVNRKLQQALDKVRGNASVTATTGSYNVFREGQKADGPWHVSGELTLTSGDFAAVASFAGELQGMGLLLGNEGFFVAPATEKAARDALAVEALSGVKERAAKLAEALGMRVEQVTDVAVGGSGPVGIRMMPMGMAMSAMAAPPMQGGQTALTVNVDATAVLVAK